VRLGRLHPDLMAAAASRQPLEAAPAARRQAAVPEHLIVPLHRQELVRARRRREHREPRGKQGVDASDAIHRKRNS